MPVKLVRNAIRSVRRQDHGGPIEVVLWDDGSCDPRSPGRLRADGRVLRRRRATGRSSDDRHVPYRQRRGIARSRNAAVRRGPCAVAALARRRRRTAARRDQPSADVGAPLPVRTPSGSAGCSIPVERSMSTVTRTISPRGRRAAERPATRSPRSCSTRTVESCDGIYSTGPVDSTRGSVMPSSSTGSAAFPGPARPGAFDVLDAVTYVHRKREVSHSSDRTRVKRQRVAALQRYARAEGMPSAELDAPIVNVATGCPEYKRVERGPDSAGVELLHVVPAGPDADSGTWARPRP